MEIEEWPKWCWSALGLPVCLSLSIASECLKRWGNTLFSNPAFVAASFIICQPLILLKGENLSWGSSFLW